MKPRLISLTAFCLMNLLAYCLKAQEYPYVKTDSLSEEKVKSLKVSRYINAQSDYLLAKKNLRISLNGRFGDFLEQNNKGGFHDFFGFDDWSDSRIALDYGLTKWLELGAGRSKQAENLDGTLKIRFFEQKRRIPLTVIYYSNTSFSMMTDQEFYLNADPAWVAVNSYIAHRINYTHQLIISREFFSRLNLQIIPTFNYRNLIYPLVNSSNGAAESNILYAAGFAGSFHLTKNLSLLADYFYIISDFRMNNTDMPFYNPLGVGIEYAKGENVFSFNCTNSPSILENAFLPNTRDSWVKGGFKLGFQLAHVFSFDK